LILWEQYENCSSEFLNRHHHLVLHATWHRIQAFLLHPAWCCETSCHICGLREQIILSLNVDLYNGIEEQGESSDLLPHIAYLLKIPADSVFRKQHSKLYSLWNIRRDFERLETENHFRIVNRLVWGLLCLAKTYKVSPYGEFIASINETIPMIVGHNPLKAKHKTLQKADYLCGEKGYEKYFKKYRAVCHFIAALEFMKRRDSLFSLKNPDHIAMFLRISHWFREVILSLGTPNIREKSHFLSNPLLALPSWVDSNEVDIPINHSEDKLKEILSKVVIISTSSSF
jgi:hypothetical protein